MRLSEKIYLSKRSVSKLGYYPTMKPDRRPVAEVQSRSGITKRPPSSGRRPGTEAVEDIGRGQLFHGFRPYFKHDAALWAAAKRVIACTRSGPLDRKKRHTAGSLGNERPYELLKAGKIQTINEELDRIDYGVYV